MTTRKQFLLDLIEANPALNVKVRKKKTHFKTNIKAKIVPVNAETQLNLSGEVYFFLKKNPRLTLTASEVAAGLAKEGLFYSVRQVTDALKSLANMNSIKRNDVTPTELLVRGYHGRTRNTYQWSARLVYKGLAATRKIRVNPGVKTVNFLV